MMIQPQRCGDIWQSVRRGICSSGLSYSILGAAVFNFHTFERNRFGNMEGSMRGTDRIFSVAGAVVSGTNAVTDLEFRNFGTWN
jgi:hypothetical protein